MLDLVYVALVVAFFVAAAAYVVACDRVIGLDEDDLVEGGERDDEPQPAVEQELVEVAS